MVLSCRCAPAAIRFGCGRHWQSCVTMQHSAAGACGSWCVRWRMACEWTCCTWRCGLTFGAQGADGCVDLAAGGNYTAARGGEGGGVCVEQQECEALQQGAEVCGRCACARCTLATLSPFPLCLIGVDCCSQLQNVTIGQRICKRSRAPHLNEQHFRPIPRATSRCKCVSSRHCLNPNRAATKTLTSSHQPLFSLPSPHHRRPYVPPPSPSPLGTRTQALC